MDDLYTSEIRKRYDSSMTYQTYLDTHDKPPLKPIIKPKETPNLADPLMLEPPKGPKLQSPKLIVYGSDDVIFEESDIDENQPTKPIQKVPCQKALIEHNIRIRSQTENLGFSVFRFLQQKNTKQR